MSHDLTRQAIWLFGAAIEPGTTMSALLSQVRASFLVEQARCHRVAAVVAANLQLLDVRQPLDTDMKRAVVDLMTGVMKEAEFSTLLHAEQVDLQNFCNANGLVAHLIKGKPRESLYSSPYTRHSGDVDLLVPDIETAGCIIEWLQDHRYDWDPEELPWFKRWRPEGDGRFYGQAALIKEDSASKAVFRFDLHFGGYSIGDIGFLPFEDVNSSWEGELIILLGHTLGEGFFTVKDLNDWRMIAVTQSVDWGRVSLLAEQASLTPMLRAMEQLDKWQSRLHNGVQKKLPLNVSVKHHKYTRSGRVAYHTFAVSRKLNGSVTASLQRAVRSFVYYSQEHSLQIKGGFIRSPRFDAFNVDRWHCWRLVPISEPMEGGIDLWGRWFWPTVWYDVPDPVLCEVVT
jgi:hypothetical protein